MRHAALLVLLVMACHRDPGGAPPGGTVTHGAAGGPAAARKAEPLTISDEELADGDWVATTDVPGSNSYVDVLPSVQLQYELKAAGASTMEKANAYLRERYITTHNEFLARAPRDPESAFVELGEVDLNEIFCMEAVRTVGKDNVVSMEGTALQIARQPGRPTCTGLHVTVRRHLDGCYSIRRGTQVFGRYDADGQPIESRRPVEAAGPVENRKRTRFPTRTLDAGKRRRRPQLPHAPSQANI